MAKTKKNIVIKTNGTKKLYHELALQLVVLRMRRHRRSSAVFSAGRAWCCLFFCEIESKKLRIVHGA
jgi:hypothetical protein